MRSVGILICGCGVYDGTDVQEAVLIAAALDGRGLRGVFLSPAGEQADVVDHGTGSVDEGAPPRRVESESARIARGAVRTLDELLPGELDALFIPGGVGVVRNLCEPGGSPLGGGPLRPDVLRLLDEFRSRQAPVAAIGLASVVVRRHAGLPLTTELLHAPPGEILREDGGRVLIAAGFLGSNSITEVAATLGRLADLVAERLGAAPLLQVRPPQGKPS